jgi:hypothetical protein
MIFILPDAVSARRQAIIPGTKGGRDFLHKFEVPGQQSANCSKGKHDKCTSLRCTCDCHKETI